MLPQPEERPAEEAHAKAGAGRAAKAGEERGPAKEPRRIEAPTREESASEANASAPSTAANNIGIGRSDSDTTIRVSSRRICAATSNIPSDARSRGDQGTATVSFSLDGGGA